MSWLPAVVLPSIPTALVLGALTGGWRYVPFAIALAVCAAGIPMGVGTVMSSLVPFPVPDTGNPFANRQANTGRGCLIGIVTMVALALDAVLLLPVIVAVVMAHDRGLPWLALVLVPILVWSLLVWAVGIAVATRRVRGREPELLEAVAWRV